MDKNSDYIFKAFIVNSAEYDNGNKETSGAWLYFPTTKEKVSALFKEIGLPNKADSDQYFIDEYKCGNDGFEKFLSIDSNIDELNYLANRISELEDIEMTVFQTVIQTKECQSIKDAINITYNMECYEVIPDINNFEELGQYLFFENERIVSLDMSTYNDFDFVGYAKEMTKGNGSYLVDGVYLKADYAKREDKYNGNIEDIPNEYLVTENGEHLRRKHLLDIEIEVSQDLAFDIDRYMRSTDKEYSAKYPDDFDRMKYYSDCLIEGRTDELKDILTAIGTHESDELVDRICEFEQEYVINNEPEKESEEQKMSDKIKVLVVEPMQEPYIKEIDAGLKSLQKEVDGSIQAVYPFEEEAAIICNEEGKINGLELNRALYDEDGKIYDIIAGTFLICGLTDDNFGSLPDELINKFSEQFKQPETFVKIGHEIISISAEPIKRSDLHMEGNNGIISFGNSSTNVIISTKSQQLKTNSRIDGVPRNMPPKDKKLSIKEQLQQAKKEQGEQSEPKPPRHTPPEL